MKNKTEVERALGRFGLTGECKVYGNGHINDTYLIDGEYLIQRVNTEIFKNPQQLMSNIERVTDFLRKKIILAGGDDKRETLTIVKTLDGQNYYRASDDSFFRVYKFIKNTKTAEHGTRPADLYYAGLGFGRFQAMLSDFPADELFYTIEDFHNTSKRVEALKTSISQNKADRLKYCQNEVDFAINRAYISGTIVDELEKGTVLLRVTHNDTKINNILFDINTGEPVCVIDLDTVMPGSCLYDFGDALRLGASTAAEDETRLEKVSFDVESFAEFTRGYFEAVGNSLTEKETALLAFSVLLMTYECGIRFLTDFLNGDTYFKTKSEFHNLDRAKNQFKLVEDIAGKMDRLNEIVYRFAK